MVDTSVMMFDLSHEITEGMATCAADAAHRNTW